MATHSSILAWRIPKTEELGGLQSDALQRVRHNWSHLAHTIDKPVTIFNCLITVYLLFNYLIHFI